MKIAIIGATGFVGRVLCQEALRQNHQLVCLDINKPEENSIFDDERVEFIQSSCDAESLEKALTDVDGVVCLAAIRPIGTFGLKEYQANINIACNVMQACININLKNAVFISSRSVYSNEEKPWRENAMNIALNLYGESKNAIDSLIVFMNKSKDMNFKSLRLAQVMGLGEKKGFLLNTLIDHASKKETLTIYGSGCGERQYIYIKDVVAAILLAVEKTDVNGIFNIGMDNSVSIYDLALIVNEVFENVGNLERKLDLPEDKNNYMMNVNKAKEELGFEPYFKNVREALMDIRNDLIGK